MYSGIVLFARRDCRLARRRYIRSISGLGTSFLRTTMSSGCGDAALSESSFTQSFFSFSVVAAASALEERAVADWKGAARAANAPKPNCDVDLEEANGLADEANDENVGCVDFFALGSGMPSVALSDSLVADGASSWEETASVLFASDVVVANAAASFAEEASVFVASEACSCTWADAGAVVSSEGASVTDASFLSDGVEAIDAACRCFFTGALASSAAEAGTSFTLSSTTSSSLRSRLRNVGVGRWTSS